MRPRRCWHRPLSANWRVDETYVRAMGRWMDLYRAMDKPSDTVDFHPSPIGTKAAKRLLRAKRCVG